jgi:ATP-dependent helicase HrpB
MRSLQGGSRDEFGRRERVQSSPLSPTLSPLARGEGGTHRDLRASASEEPEEPEVPEVPARRDNASVLALPVDAYLDEILAAVRKSRRLVVVAPPGAGKTTRIPPALAMLGRTILLQPRRVAARTLARRIADERNWTVGEEVGWQIRFERRFNARTRLLVATEGILTARLQSDPLLEDFNCIILDEFHERSIHADLALALARQAVESRDDLSLVVMSATIDAAPIAAYLDAAIVTIETRTYPVDVRHRAALSVEDAVREAASDAKGDLLCFLPGSREIEDVRRALALPNVFTLHGGLDVEAQELALAPSRDRKIILATNVAETSLTVEGVSDVIDSGLHKVLRFDAETAVDHLVTEQISRDSADQRAGRAGRTGPGRATRLWDERMLLRPQREPEIRRVDLASTVLGIVAWGGDPLTFDWFEKPPQARVDAALELLRRLGAIEQRRLTPLGERLRNFPLHPRLARVLIDANGADHAARVCALLSEERRGSTIGDALTLADAPHLRNPARELSRIAQRLLADAYQHEAGEETLRRALLAGYPDRVGIRRAPGSLRLLLASGTGAVLARESGLHTGEFVVALDVSGGQESLVRIASVVERDWLTPTHEDVVHSLSGTRVKATRRLWYSSILLREINVETDPEEERRLRAEALLGKIDADLQRRLNFAEVAVDWPQIVATTGTLQLPWDLSRRLEQLAPERLALPSGRTTQLDYREDGSVVASVKLQELFGLADSPRLGPNRKPVTFALLSPAGRPVQVTSDLRSFWSNGYQEVRRELRARYPKHPWPDDPWTAEATHRTRRK